MEGKEEGEESWEEEEEGERMQIERYDSIHRYSLEVTVFQFSCVMVEGEERGICNVTQSMQYDVDRELLCYHRREEKRSV